MGSSTGAIAAPRVALVTVGAAGAKGSAAAIGLMSGMGGIMSDVIYSTGKAILNSKPSKSDCMR